MNNTFGKPCPWSNQPLLCQERAGCGGCAIFLMEGGEEVLIDDLSLLWKVIKEKHGNKNILAKRSLSYVEEESDD